MADVSYLVFVHSRKGRCRQAGGMATTFELSLGIQSLFAVLRLLSMCISLGLDVFRRPPAVLLSLLDRAQAPRISSFRCLVMALSAYLLCASWVQSLPQAIDPTVVFFSSIRSLADLVAVLHLQLHYAGNQNMRT
jgi:hypothetical protein